MNADLSLGPGVGRGALRGAAAGFALALVGGLVLGHLIELPWIDAVAISMFAAVWVGPGFGIVFGAVVAISRNARSDQAAPLRQRGRSDLTSSNRSNPTP